MTKKSGKKYFPSFLGYNVDAPNAITDLNRQESLIMDDLLYEEAPQRLFFSLRQSANRGYLCWLARSPIVPYVYLLF